MSSSSHWRWRELNLQNIESGGRKDSKQHRTLGLQETQWPFSCCSAFQEVSARGLQTWRRPECNQGCQTWWTPQTSKRWPGQLALGLATLLGWSLVCFGGLWMKAPAWHCATSPHFLADIHPFWQHLLFWINQHSGKVRQAGAFPPAPSLSREVGAQGTALMEIHTSISEQDAWEPYPLSFQLHPIIT